MIKLSGQTLGLSLCEALGISGHNVQRIEVIADCLEPARVRVISLLPADAANSVSRTVEEYSLVKCDKADNINT